MGDLRMGDPGMGNQGHLACQGQTGGDVGTSLLVLRIVFLGEYAREGTLLVVGCLGRTCPTLLAAGVVGSPLLKGKGKLKDDTRGKAFYVGSTVTIVVIFLQVNQKPQGELIPLLFPSYLSGGLGSWMPSILHISVLG